MQQGTGLEKGGIWKPFAWMMLGAVIAFTFKPVRQQFFLFDNEKPTVNEEKKKLVTISYPLKENEDGSFEVTLRTNRPLRCPSNEGERTGQLTVSPSSGAFPKGGTEVALINVAVEGKCVPNNAGAQVLVIESSTDTPKLESAKGNSDQ